MRKLILLICFGSCCFSACKSIKKEENIDHIILAINNLDTGVKQFKELTGIEPVFGGIHPESFTQNALIALDGETYIEIMAPRPNTENVPEYFTKIKQLTPIGWAIRTHNIQLTKDKLRSIGLKPTENHPGSRATPDGSLLKWTTFTLAGHDKFPFFIQWSDSTIHPATSSPKGCTLQSLQVLTNDYESLSRLNLTLKLGLTLEESRDSSIVLAINTPKGLIVFSQKDRAKK
jgi:hypothetical protein